MGKRWLPLESNPDVISNYVVSLGGPKCLDFVDVYSCEQWALDLVPLPVYAILFLFPCTAVLERERDLESQRIKVDGQYVSPKVWYTNQTIGNACGTIGILHAVANIKDKVPCVKGGYFDRFFNLVESLDPSQRAQVLENDEELEASHATFERQGQSRSPDRDEEIFLHFITFIEKDGSIYELDGRKAYPVNHGKTTDATFLKDTTTVIQKKFISHEPTDVHFSIIAICAKG
ncbi:ubiquitin carboxyl-terminal hydrolase UCHL3 [Cardiosporidium cionae]|uniref:Ubiquitin carboxyl-terminal hydrolase n=1 Tax=Cardiosporidium cionae TaxID=476202 RepID=A0ABQ7JEF1_9APIC|nr:ubiquitin carboxyl-terminal hydrolase UCHL3 [Cardiosporidium cionae]|eukprot:KAF8822376.1 ubiquitin carboxyl-terminal hydrolase UCHL3 [Cardiosporidium cionae]